MQDQHQTKGREGGESVSPLGGYYYKGRISWADFSIVSMHGRAGGRFLSLVDLNVSRPPVVSGKGLWGVIGQQPPCGWFPTPPSCMLRSIGGRFLVMKNEVPYIRACIPFFLQWWVSFLKPTAFTDSLSNLQCLESVGFLLHPTAVVVRAFRELLRGKLVLY